jgi:predicted transcriptional regulator
MRVASRRWSRRKRVGNEERQLIELREAGTRKRRAGSEDVEIGRKIRALRLQRGLSQTSLAEGIGLTFQQVQKYEKGTNRVSAGRLQKIAEMLDTPVTFGSVQNLSHI